MIHRLHTGYRGIVFYALLFLLAASLSGCGNDYELRVRLEESSEVAKHSAMYFEGMEIGKVQSMEIQDGRRTAVAVIRDLRLARAAIRYGVRIIERPDGSLEVDASAVVRGSAPLPSGSILEAKRQSLLERYLRKYATWQTIAVVGVGTAALFVALIAFKLFFKVGVIAISLLLSGGFAWTASPYLTGPVERFLYLKTQASQAPEAAAPDAVGTWEKVESDEAAPQSTAPIVHSPSRVGLIALPDPKWLTFFLCWLAGFVVIQLLVGMAFRATRR